MPSHDFTPTPGLEVDGYHLVRFLGRGGFGEVWLCRSGTTASHHAIKFISGADPDLLEKEHHSLTLYRAAAGLLRSPHLISIEHINRHGGTLYYVMPLADGITATDPADPSWQPLSLAALIEARASAPGGYEHWLARLDYSVARADLTAWPHHGPLGCTCELVQLDVGNNSAARAYPQAVGLLCERTYALDVTVI